MCLPYLALIIRKSWSMICGHIYYHLLHLICCIEALPCLLQFFAASSLRSLFVAVFGWGQTAPLRRFRGPAPLAGTCLFRHAKSSNSSVILQPSLFSLIFPLFPYKFELVTSLSNDYRSSGSTVVDSTSRFDVASLQSSILTKMNSRRIDRFQPQFKCSFYNSPVFNSNSISPQFTTSHAGVSVCPSRKYCCQWHTILATTVFFLKCLNMHIVPLH